MIGVPEPENPHALPTPFVVILFAALAGGVGPGVFMTLTSAPGNRGSPLYGLLLPWTVLPFGLAVAAGWRAREHRLCVPLAVVAAIAAGAGLTAYMYGLIIHPKGAQNTQLFGWIPALQLLVLARLSLRAFRSAS